MKSITIEGIVNNERISTQNLLQSIQARIEEGYTDFEIHACGQHVHRGQKIVTKL